MEYEFVHDTSTGIAQARFSFEHQAIGPWLEVEVGDDVVKLTDVLTAMSDVKSGKRQEVMLVGCEYSVLISVDDVHIQPNMLVNEQQNLPVELGGDQLEVDNMQSTYCGCEDFRALLISWAKFTGMH